MRDNPNPNASVAILCHFPFFYNVNRSVYEHLLPDVEFVPNLFFKIGSNELSKDEAERFLKHLSNEGVYWRNLETSNLTPNEFFSKYHTLVGNIFEGWMKHPVNIQKRKVRVFYGVAKNLWMYALWNSHFDLICSPGEPYTVKLDKLYDAKVVTTGEPKFDIAVGLDKEITRSDLGIGMTGKPVIMIAATWGKLSSLELLLPHVLRLVQDYEVVVKVHHMTDAFDPEVIKQLTSSKIKIIDQYVPVPKALLAVDIVVSDNSGLIFDAVNMNVPLVLIDFIGPYNEEFFADKAFYGLMSSGKLKGAATSLESDEQIIKRAIKPVAPVVPLYKKDSFEELHKLFMQALNESGSVHYSDNRQEYAKEHFSKIDGNAGKRIAEQVRLLTSVGQGRTFDTTRSKLVLDLEARIIEGANTNERATIKKLNEEIIDYRSIKNMPIFSRLIAIHKRFF